MAIVIPSKHIYGTPQVAKVRDNVIERIEVGAKEVVPDNDYNVSVHNQAIYNNFANEAIIENEQKYDGDWSGDVIEYAFYKLKPTYSYDVKIVIPKLKENHFISEIFFNAKEENGEKKPSIEKTIHAKVYTGTIETSAKNVEFVYGTNGMIISQIKYDIYYGTPIYNEEKTQTFTELSPDLQYNFSYSSGISGVTASISFDNKQNLMQPLFSQDEKNYYLEFTVFVGYEEIKGGAFIGYFQEEQPNPQETLKVSTCTKIVPEKVEFTIYGNTIGIDLTDKTVYIPESDRTSKKVVSFDGNELMQTSNYLVNPKTNKLVENEDYTVTYYNDLEGQYPAPEGTYGVKAEIKILKNELLGSNFIVRLYDGYNDNYNDILFENQETERISVDDGGYYIGKVEVFQSQSKAIESMYSETQKKYKNGKETITLRCSISEYYNEQGELTISAKDTALPMCFNLYDEVMPMVLGLNGKDKPMSVSQDGTPKKFKVLSVRPFYDGAVWQELLLQEIL